MENNDKNFKRYYGIDWGHSNDVTGATLFFDCQRCHGSGCDFCGGTGVSNEPVFKIDTPKQARLKDMIELLKDKKVYFPKDNPKLMAELEKFVYKKG